MKDYRYLQQKYLVNTYPDRGITLVAGDGVYLLDISGEKYLDMMTNYGVNIFGYNHPQIIQGLVPQLQRLTTLHGSFNNDKRALAAMTLVKRCGGALSQVYFSNSGSEAMEAALKFAVLATGKKKFLSCRNGYHGKTLGSLSATACKKHKLPFEPLLWDFHNIDFNNLQQLEAAIDGNTTAILVEPIQGEGGVIVPETGYLKRVKELCERSNILLILDEVQTGTGRTGYFLASQAEGLSYDILCLGKGLAGGLPIGATLISPKVAEKIPKSIHTSTFGGNPLSALGILLTLDLLDENRLSHIQKVGDYFLDEMKKLKSDFIQKVRGKGLMIGIEVVDKRNKILQSLQKEKILAIPATDNVIRFLPPYIIEKNHVDTVSVAMDRILKTL